MHIQTHAQEQFPIRALNVTACFDGAGKQFSAMVCLLRLQYLTYNATTND